jgi:hypothetical protein
MAYTDYLLRFRQKDDAWLRAKQTELEAQETIFSQQGMGNTSMTRDLRMLEDKLTAIAYVLRERGGVVITKPALNPSVGVADFSYVDRPGSGAVDDHGNLIP